MTKEKKQMVLMTPKEKEFYLQFKKENPENEAEYRNAWAKYVQEIYKRTGKIIY